MLFQVFPVLNLPEHFGVCIDDTPIDLYQVDILHRLQSDGPSSFEDIFKDSNNRFVMIGLFLAMLELIRSKLVGIEQPKDPSDGVMARNPVLVG